MSYLKFLFILIVPVMTTSCAQPPKAAVGDSRASASSIAEDIDVTAFSTKMGAETDYILLDVRTPAEIAEAKIQDAVEIDFRQQGFLEKVNQLPKDKPVFIYCRSGNRSGQAMARMRELGFVEMYNLKGGILAWQNSGRPVVSQ